MAINKCRIQMVKDDNNKHYSVRIWRVLYEKEAVVIPCANIEQAETLIAQLVACGVEQMPTQTFNT